MAEIHVEDCRTTEEDWDRRRGGVLRGHLVDDSLACRPIVVRPGGQQYDYLATTDYALNMSQDQVTESFKRIDVAAAYVLEIDIPRPATQLVGRYASERRRSKVKVYDAATRELPLKQLLLELLDCAGATASPRPLPADHVVDEANGQP